MWLYKGPLAEHSIPRLRTPKGPKYSMYLGPSYVVYHYLDPLGLHSIYVGLRRAEHQQIGKSAELARTHACAHTHTHA